MCTTLEFNLGKQIESQLGGRDSAELSAFHRHSAQTRCHKGLRVIHASSHSCRLLLYLMDEVAYVSWVGGCRADGVLVVVMEGPLIQTSDPHFDALWLQGVRLLQLAQVVVLNSRTNTHVHMLALQ